MILFYEKRISTFKISPERLIRSYRFIDFELLIYKFMIDIVIFTTFYRNIKGLFINQNKL